MIPEIITMALVLSIAIYAFIALTLSPSIEVARISGIDLSNYLEPLIEEILIERGLLCVGEILDPPRKLKDGYTMHMVRDAKGRFNRAIYL